MRFGLDLHCHEKWNGSGYPKGLSGEDIPLSARITALADVYDALSSRRPYKEPFSHEKSRAIILEGRGSHFDPRVLDRFKALAAELHGSYGGREDEGLKQELNNWTRRCFNAGLDSLGY